MQKCKLIKKSLMWMLSFTMALSMCFSIVKKVEANDGQADNAVVVTNSKDEEIHDEYLSIQEAIANIGDYNYDNNRGTYTITLLKDVQEDVVIPVNKNITIDLAGHTLTNVSSHTILNQSIRTFIIDTSEYKTGVVDNITNGKGALYNDINASIVLRGGTFTRSMEQSVSSSDGGNNSWYVIKNFGTMTIEDDVNVKFSASNTGLYSSLIGNGWFDKSAAEAGTNGEPKPSEGGNSAKLTINGGTFTGGTITIKNDDFGVLTIKDGTINQPNNDRYAVLNNNTATISGGTINATGTGCVAVGSLHYDGGANSGDLTISGGAFTSSNTVIMAGSGADLTVTGGSYTTTSTSAYIISVDEGATAQVSGGSYHGADIENIINNKKFFKDGYGARTDNEGNIIVGVTNEAAEAVVRDVNGNTTNYLTLSLALSNAPAGSVVQLQKDLVLTSGVETKNYGVTLDLNGYNIDGSAITKNGGRVVYLRTLYSSKPVEGIDSTMRVINSVNDRGGKISGVIPIEVNSGNSMIQLPAEIGEGVTLEVLEGGSDAVKLGTSAVLVYNEMSAEFIKNGGYLVTAEDGVQYIYGKYSSAIQYAADGVVTMLHDYTGNESIVSGNQSGTLDLSGHTYTYTGTQKIADVNYDGAGLTIKNGTVKTVQNLSDAGVLMLCSNTTLVLENVEMTVLGEVYGIVTNGMESNNDIKMTDSVLNVEEGYGIYFPSSGSVTVENSVIKAKYVGIQLCAGSLYVSGEKTLIRATESAQPKAEGDGVIADGAAISVVKREGYQDLGSVIIEDGTFIANSDSKAIKAYSFSNENKTEEQWDEAGNVIGISGGNFSSKVPAELCADKFAPTELDPETGTYTVVKDTQAPLLKNVQTDAELVSGTYYGGELKFTVTDDRLKSVEVNGQEISSENGVYTIRGEGKYTIVAEDEVGNRTELELILSAGKGVISTETTQVTLLNELVANGEEQVQEIKVVVNDVVLVEGIDYTVSGNKATEAGTYTLTVSGIGNYEGSIEVEYTVSSAEDPDVPQEPSTPGESEKPSDPQTPSEPSKEDPEEEKPSETPSTGDMSLIACYGLMMILSAMILVVLMKKNSLNKG